MIRDSRGPGSYERRARASVRSHRAPRALNESLVIAFMLGATAVVFGFLVLA